MRKSIKNAMCAAVALASAGCTQLSMPSAEIITKPSSEAFARLSAVRLPWQQPTEPTPLVIQPAVEVATPIMAPQLQVAPEPPAPRSQAAPVIMRAVVPSVSTRATARDPFLMRAPAPPAALVVPAKVTCQTRAEPGQRVRMECMPAE